MKPLIGVLTEITNERTVSAQYLYTKPIESAGGIPIVIPFTLNSELISKYAELCDGFFFSGGADIDPLYYGEEAIHECGEIQPYRDSVEFLMFNEAFKLKKPILAVCRGAQLVNVALGGALYQDIHSEFKTTITHRQIEPKLAHSHEVDIMPGTPLYELFGQSRARVNSFHHQAVKFIGKDLSVMAMADDGLIEAFYYVGDGYLRAYQWHPERLYDQDNYNKRVFEDFIRECKKESEK